MDGSATSLFHTHHQPLLLRVGHLPTRQCGPYALVSARASAVQEIQCPAASSRLAVHMCTPELAMCLPASLGCAIMLYSCNDLPPVCQLAMRLHFLW